MKRRISIFFLTLSVALMMGHNLIPHCHDGHLGHDHGAKLETQREFCLGHGLLGDVFSTVAHNHAGMVFFEHLQGEQSLELKSEKKSLPKVESWEMSNVFAELPIKHGSFSPPSQYLSDPPNIRGLRAPPIFS